MNQVLPVLLAEDDPNEVFLLQRAFSEAGITNPVIVVRDGKETIEYLQGHGENADRQEYPEPCLLLLDLRMPGMDGFDVLAWLRGQPLLHLTLPVVVITDSYNSADMEKALALGARSLFVKPFDHKQKVELLRELKALYLTPDWILAQVSSQRLAANIPFHVFLTPPPDSHN